MKFDYFERGSFYAVFFSLCAILLYLALLVESARGGVFSPYSLAFAYLGIERAMISLLLTAVFGLGLDYCLKKRKDTKK